MFRKKWKKILSKIEIKKKQCWIYLFFGGKCTRIYSRRTDTNKTVTPLNWLMQTLKKKRMKQCSTYRWVKTSKEKNEKSCQVIADHFDGIKCIFLSVFRLLCVLRWASFHTNIWMCAFSKLSHLFCSRCIFLFHYQSMLHIRVMSLSQSKSNPHIVCNVYTEASLHNWSND